MRYADVTSNTERRMTVHQLPLHGTRYGPVRKTKGWKRFSVEVSLNHMALDGQRFVMGLVTDISMRRVAELDLQRSKQELEDRVEQRTAELKRRSKRADRVGKGTGTACAEEPVRGHGEP
ncbi:MAG: hypothetical protein R2818_02965 [Flavobacteriales bacterium]